MSKELSFYEKNTINFQTKFYRYMDNLVTHKSGSRIECVILIIISYTQLISGFFSVQVGILSTDIPDYYFEKAQTVLRIRDLFQNSFGTYSLIMYLILVCLIILTAIFIYRVATTGKTVFYSYCEIILNFSLKLFVYVLFQPILDFCLSLICFSGTNPNFSNVTCSFTDKIPLLIVMILTLIYSIFLAIFTSLFYNESFMLSNSYFSRISTKYELYLSINAIFFSIVLTYTFYLGALIFIIYNIILSLVLYKFYFQTHPYYDTVTNLIIGYFHLLYVWASLFTLLFHFVKCEQVSIVFVAIGLVLFYMHYNIHFQIQENITLNTQFHKLRNKHDILLYIKGLIGKMNTIESNAEDKAEIVGIVHLHKVECPLIECPSKIEKKKFYLPITDEWSKPDKTEINDRVYLNNFITFVFDFYINQNLFSSDILMNLSIYYLQIIGNHCGAMYYCQKAGNEQKLTSEEKFMHFRMGELISKALVKQFKPSNEIAGTLEEVNTSMYFKYQDLSEKFFSEISTDIGISTEFWRLFITKDIKRKKLDFNKIFSLTDKIRITKAKIEKVWNELFETYNGCNELFDLYECYVEYINDDDMLLRELLKIRNKNYTMEGVLNYYHTLFNHETGIIIASGDKGKEGMIEKVSENLTQIFQFNEEELKGMNVGFLMPRMFEKDHRRFMQRYINVGEKRALDRTMKVYAKDKNNNIVVLNMSIKLFPILGESTFFCSMITKENLDDVILLDQEYNIQGMSSKLYSLFKLNQNIFQDCDVPFWMICKEFIHHYQIFMANNPNIKYNYSKKADALASKSLVKSNISLPDDSTLADTGKNSLSNNTEMEFEINENADVQWDITIPPFFKLYIAEENKQQNFISMTIGINRDESEHLSSDVIMENSREEDENYTEETNKMLPSNLESSTDKSQTQSYQQDHDKDFQNQIGRYRSFFTSNTNNNFNELISKLDNLNEGNAQVFHFVISFSQIRYGESKIGYVIRCIEIKSENDLSSNDEKGTQKSDDKEKDKGNKFNLDKGFQQGEEVHQGVFDRRKYLTGLKGFDKTTDSDLAALDERLKEFHRLTLEDAHIKTSVDNYHQEILLLSRVLGANAAAVLDENGSQSSSTSQYTNSITKKSRVQEIKSHIMTNVKDFYTLKMIKWTFALFMLFSAIIGVIFLLQFDTYLNTSRIINSLHSSFSNIFLCYTESISKIISLKAMGIIHLHRGSYGFDFNAYTKDPNEADMAKVYAQYYSIQNQSVFEKYLDLIDKTSQFELNYTREIRDPAENFLIWSTVLEGFSFSGEKNDISFMMSVGQTLSYIQELLAKPEFAFPLDFTNPVIEPQWNYITYKIIENTYTSDLPHMLSLLYNMTEICANQNKTNILIVIYLLVGYCLVIALFSFFYGLFLFLTNKNMEDGLIVISRIDPILIDETIKQIDIFNKTILSKFRQKGEKDGSHQRKGGTFGETNASTMSVKSKEDEDKENEGEEDNGYYDPQLHKKLNILLFSYFQIFILLALGCLFLIPIFLKCYTLLDNTNQFMSMKDSFYFQLLTSSLDMLNIKIKIINSTVTNYLEVNGTVSQAEKNVITKQMNTYPVLESFYQTKYLNSICKAIYSDEGNIAACQSDSVLTEYCTITNLYRIIADNIFAIDKELEIQLVKGEQYNKLKGYSSENFRVMEYIENKYFFLIPNVIEAVFVDSINWYLKQLQQDMTLLLVFFIIGTWLFSLYIIFFYINNLIHLLLISRCIFKIIPTKVINKTQELEDWIDDKY